MQLKKEKYFKKLHQQTNSFVSPKQKPWKYFPKWTKMFKFAASWQLVKHITEKKKITKCSNSVIIFYKKF